MNNGFTFTSHYLDFPIRTGRVYDLFLPEKIQHDIAVFMVHGGGWRAGSRAGYFHTLMQRLNELGYIAASTDYRLNVTAAEQLSDIRSAYMHFCQELKKMGRPQKIAVYGSSAGAHLGSLLTCADPGDCGDTVEFTEKWIPPYCGMFQACPASFVPWEDIFPHVWTAMQDVAGVAYGKNPEVYRKLSLDHQIRPGNPPVFFPEAECEHIFFSDQKVALTKRMAKMGNTATVKMYARAEHGFIYSFDRPKQREAFDDLIRFMEGEKIENCIFSNRTVDAKQGRILS